MREGTGVYWTIGVETSRRQALSREVTERRPQLLARRDSCGWEDGWVDGLLSGE